MGLDPTLAELADLTSRPDPDIDLPRAALVLARIEQPAVDVEKYLGRLAALAANAPSPRRAGDQLERLHRLREYLFEEQGFAGNAKDYFDPRNSFLNEVLDRRLGIPITLSLVLIDVGRRLGLEMEGIGLPGHFITGVRVGGEHVLLDAFNRGAVLTGEACGELVARAVGKQVELTPALFAPVGNRQILVRMLANLKGIYWQAEAWDKALRVIDRLVLLMPRAGGEWRDRGRAWNALGESRRAVADWERYLTEFPEAPDREQVRAELRRVRQRLSRLN